MSRKITDEVQCSVSLTIVSVGRRTAALAHVLQLARRLEIEFVPMFPYDVILISCNLI